MKTLLIQPAATQLDNTSTIRTRLIKNAVIFLSQILIDFIVCKLPKSLFRLFAIVLVRVTKKNLGSVQTIEGNLG